MKGELGIAVSRKPAASAPFDTTFSAIGATFYLAGDQPFVQPIEATLTKLRVMTQRAASRSRSWGLEEAQTLVGLIECVAPFAARSKAERIRNSADMLLAPQRGVPQQIRFLSLEFVAQLQMFVACCVPAKYVALVRSPR